MPIISLSKRWIWMLVLALAVPSLSEEQLQADGGGTAGAAKTAATQITGKETLHYEVEWRLIRAGNARLSWTPGQDSYQGALHLESAGLVSKLYKVQDEYIARITHDLCMADSVLKAQEGKRNRETKIAVDAARKKLSYHERDVLKNTTVLAKEIDVPGCVTEIVSGLYRLRTLNLQPGQSGQVPLTDGKKFANVKVEALERETVKTPTGTHKTIKHEAHIFNNVIYSRPGRCYIWLTEDARRTPVQIQVRLRFLIGTITLTLEKEERG